MADLDLAQLRRLAEAARRLAPADVTEALWVSYLAIRANDDSYARLTNNDLSRLAAAVMPLFDHVFPEPAVVLQLLDRLEAAEARVRELEGAVAHTHTTAPGTGTLTHAHRKGDVPHGHHGWRYGTPVPEEPESTPAAEHFDCSACRGTGLVPSTGNGGDGYEPCPACVPWRGEKLTDLMAALEESVREAKGARARHPRAADTQEAHDA